MLLIVALIDSAEHLSVLDPACGDGELLVSIAKHLADKGNDFSITGFDSNRHYLTKSQTRLNHFLDCSLQLVEGDFLEHITPPDQQLSIGFDTNMPKQSLVSADIIIANPPYVRTQVLGATELFDAAVLPAILIGRKKTAPLKASSARFVKLYEELNGYQGDFKSVNSVYDILNNEETGYFRINEKCYKKTEGILGFGTTKTSTWELLSGDETEWTTKIESASTCRIGELFKVKVGIKTTADPIFISDNWESLQEEKPEEELLKRLISQETVRTLGSLR